MESKEVIKYVAIAAGVYVVYVYVRDGNLNNLFTPLTSLFSGTASTAPTVTSPAGVQVPVALGFTLLSAPVPDVNNSLKAMVHFANGQTIQLNVIPGQTSIWDPTGADVSQVLAGEGVDTAALINALVSAYQPAAVQVSLPPTTPTGVGPTQTAVDPTAATQLRTYLAALQTQYNATQNPMVQAALQPQIDAVKAQMASLGISGLGDLGAGQASWMGIPVPRDKGWIN
jgi:hypothetical protein